MGTVGLGPLKLRNSLTCILVFIQCFKHCSFQLQSEFQQNLGTQVKDIESTFFPAGFSPAWLLL